MSIFFPRRLISVATAVAECTSNDLRLYLSLNHFLVSLHLL